MNDPHRITNEDYAILIALRTPKIVSHFALDARNDSRAMMGKRPTNARVLWDASRQPSTASEFTKLFAA